MQPIDTNSSSQKASPFISLTIFISRHDNPCNSQIKWNSKRLWNPSIHATHPRYTSRFDPLCYPRLQTIACTSSIKLLEKDGYLLEYREKCRNNTDTILIRKYSISESTAVWKKCVSKGDTYLLEYRYKYIYKTTSSKKWE